MCSSDLGHIRNSLIAEGVVIKGATISNSVIRRGVVIEEDVVIEDSILMDFVVVKRGSRIRNVIVDKVNVIKEGESLGYDETADCGKCFIDPSGIRVLPKFGRLIEPCEEE